MVFSGGLRGGVGIGEGFEEELEFNSVAVMEVGIVGEGGVAGAG